MPIRAENKERYPKDWPAISVRIRERAGNVCEWCGVKNYEWGKWIEGRWHTAHTRGSEDSDRRFWDGREYPCHHGEHVVWVKPVKIVLTVAHLDHQPENCADENLKALCQRCHNNYDMPMRRAGIKARAREALGIVDMFAPHPQTGRPVT